MGRGGIPPGIFGCRGCRERALSVDESGDVGTASLTVLKRECGEEGATGRISLTRAAHFWSPGMTEPPRRSSLKPFFACRREAVNAHAHVGFSLERVWICSKTVKRHF